MTDRPTGNPKLVAIVGAGAAGTLTAIHLARMAGRCPAAVDVVLVDPAAEVGRGVAYATADPRHLLNVPASGMSAWPQEPDHFVEWLRARVDPATCADDFVPRHRYGTYLADTLAEELRRAGPTLTVRRLHQRVLAARPAPAGGARLELGDGSTLDADAVVLALGVFAPGTAWAPEPLATSSRFVADPWGDGALRGVRRGGGDVLLVGTGLTMVDVALALDDPRRALTAVSRRGRLPRAHSPYPRPALEPELPATPLHLDELRLVVGEHLEKAVRSGAGWRAAVDGLRPHTARLWGALSDAEKAEFLRSQASWWDTHRHRMPPSTAAALARMRAAGRLRVHAGAVAAAEQVDDGLVVTFADGRSQRFSWVVNCTGPRDDVHDLADPLVDCLVSSGAARPGPTGRGLAATGDGLLRPSPGCAALPVWTLGSMRRGELLESTAIPEIRAQAAHVTQQLSAAPARPSRRPVQRDLMGLPLSTGAEAATAYNEGLARLLRVQSGADDAFRRATEIDPQFALAHAALALLGHESGAGVDIATSLAAAQRAARHGDDRERSMVDVVTRRVRDCRGDGAAALLRHIEAYPRDALAVSAAVPTVAFSGVTDLQQDTWALVESLATAYGEHWWYDGLLAFVRQDQGRYDEADGIASRALATEPSAGHAVHAQTHVFYETGAHAEGLRWLDLWIETSGQAASHRAHYSWHAAMHELSLGDVEALRRRYLAQLAPPQVQGVRALVDSASLLWRAGTSGCWTGDLPIDEVLGSVGCDLLERPETPFVAMHAAVALTAQGDGDGLRRLADHAAAHEDPVMRDAVRPLCDAMLAVVEGRWSAGVALLRTVLPMVVRMGGSAAQREVVEETLLHALVAGCRYDEARALLEARLDRRYSPADRRRVEGIRRPDRGPSGAPELVG